VVLLPSGKYTVARQRLFLEIIAFLITNQVKQWGRIVSDSNNSDGILCKVVRVLSIGFHPLDPIVSGQIRRYPVGFYSFFSDSEDIQTGIGSQDCLTGVWI
jgi:hypothetical protein